MLRKNVRKSRCPSHDLLYALFRRVGILFEVFLTSQDNPAISILATQLQFKINCTFSASAHLFCRFSKKEIHLTFIIFSTNWTVGGDRLAENWNRANASLQRKTQLYYTFKTDQTGDSKRRRRSMGWKETKTQKGHTYLLRKKVWEWLDRSYVDRKYKYELPRQQSSDCEHCEFCHNRAIIVWKGKPCRYSHDAVSTV